MRLGTLTRPELIFSGLPGGDGREALRALAGQVAARGLVRNGEELFQKLWEREQLGSTGIGSGIAIPHCKLAGLRSGVVAIGLSSEGVDFGAVDGQPVRILFLVISPAESPAEHLQILAALSRWIKTDQHARKILELQDPQAVYDFLQTEG